MSNVHVVPEIRAFIEANGCESLYEHVVGMSYQEFIETPSWNIAHWGVSLEVIYNHAKLAHDTYRARARIGAVGMERNKAAWRRGRSGKPERGAIGATTLRPTPPLIDKPVVKSRAQVLGDRCCGNPGRDHIATCNPPAVHRVVRQPSPDNVYRTTAFY